ncbi:MAG: 50S ribosomal protein L24 [bacterium]
MRKLHVKKGDTVVVLSGKDKGKKGKILTALPQKERVVVEGVNIVKRHTKPTQKVMQGGIIEREAAIHSSNVMLVCNRCGKPTRFGAKQLGDGKVVRVCKNCGEVIDK